MQQDLFGQPTGLDTSDSLADWNAAMLGFLAHAAVTPKHLMAVLAAEPGFALGHAVKGLFYLLLGRRELTAVAESDLAAARTAISKQRAGVRDTLFVQALEAWLAGYPSRSVKCLERVLKAAPEDALAMKMSHAIRFVLGDRAGMRRSMERVMPAYARDHPAHGYLLGCHAFALEETGDYERAEIAGRQALWTAPDDAWGLHAVAHVHDMTGNARKGLDWLAGREGTWSHCNNFRYHVWWHKALMHLDLGEIDAVLDLYDRDIRCDRTDDYRDISNATSLLMRLELEGIDVAGRWNELAELSAARTEDGCLVFADLHYLLALTADNRETEIAALLRRMHRDAESGSDEIKVRMRSPGLSVAWGLEAFGDSRFAEAFVHLAKARSTLHLAGGSHAQRDIFERMTIDAGLRAGLLDQAEAMLDERRALRAGRDDAFAAARRDLISVGRSPSGAHSVLAR
ncbi:tetratricopeptide repeat protein [Sedimentitalea sp. JM2-8]|uniref:Tetratricopeptide repeat protein 38 n=1 Tax=Sedimentitalea xiamensis TaxID=3050037 RepID=A0ABT7FIC3_9RHOB|nr:tetratricopeptide repeat protein [Sedimentitalea xiamensis]MDK3074882.1 tetratricopeptide repeat protein [Sedimentitalea xiamensis]